MKAELIDSMGSDARVVDAARVSFSKEASNYTPEQNSKLLKYLATHGHFTPYTHPQITLRETVPIFVARQRFKHVIGFTYNEESRRYVDDTPEFFIPEVWRRRPDGSVKQGSGSDHQATEGWEVAYRAFINDAADLYAEMITDGVAPEQARMVLPQSMFTSYYVTGSLSAWARAYKLRIDPHAQKEIQELAKQWDSIIRPLFPESWAALVD
jgi:thymidylate synthase (FAD)